MGKNAKEVVSDAVSRGLESSLADVTDASAMLCPSRTWVMMDSLITMALSTRIPREIKSAARETWSIPIWKKPMSRKAIKMVTGIRLATSNPVRSPMLTNITRQTMAMLCIRFERKSLTLRWTRSGCRARKSKETPIG